jgi:hypothetical protein
MPSRKKLNGLAEDLAGHAQSALSWLHPHLAQACRAVNTSTVMIDLLDGDPYPIVLREHRPLRLALNGLQNWFTGLVSRLGFTSEVVSRVRLRFDFHADDDYDSAVEVAIDLNNGGRLVRRRDFIVKR